MGPSGPEIFTMADIMAEVRQLRARVITKDDLSRFAMKDDLKSIEDKEPKPRRYHSCVN